MSVKPTKIHGVRFWIVINGQGVTVGTFQDVASARWYADECESGAYRMI